MAYEMKPDSGSLFRNDKREKDSHPHAKGSAVIDGVHYWVDAWTNQAKDGSKYQSLKFKRKEARSGGYSGSYNGDPATNSSGGMSQRSGFESDEDLSDVPF